MYLCLCFAINVRTIEEILSRQGPVSVKDIQKLCKVGKGCGSCLCELKALIHKRKNAKQTKQSEEKDNFPNRWTG